MRIQFKRHDGKSGDTDDPKTGVPMSVTSLVALLRGKVISGFGGFSADTENFQIFFSDGTGLWFVTTRGRPRILFQDSPWP